MSAQLEQIRAGSLSSVHITAVLLLAKKTNCNVHAVVHHGSLPVLVSWAWQASELTPQILSDCSGSKLMTLPRNLITSHGILSEQRHSDLGLLAHPLLVVLQDSQTVSQRRLHGVVAKPVNSRECCQIPCATGPPISGRANFTK